MYWSPTAGLDAQPFRHEGRRFHRAAQTLLFALAPLLLATCRPVETLPARLEDVPAQAHVDRTLRALEILSADTVATDIGWVRGIRTDDEGRLYVHDHSEQQIVVLDSTGTRLRTLGRRGAGPGEFEFISGFDVRGDGTVVVADGQLSRLTVFGSDGAMLASRGTDGRTHGIAATAKAFVVFDPLARAAFRVLSDSLADGLEVPLIADFDAGGDPMEQLRRAEGQVDGVAAGYVLVTMYTRMILVYDSEGRLTGARRTIDGPPLSEVARALDTEMTEGVAFSMLVNATDAEIHVISTAQADPFLVDVYRRDDARYSHSFEIPHPECGPRYVDERVIVSGCADGPVLRTAYRLVSGD